MDLLKGLRSYGGFKLRASGFPANTTEPSVCGGDAALCQIALTTCYVKGANDLH